MRLLHTGDWHLGRRLYGRERREEFQAFLQWLLEVLQSQAVDCLLVAGDVFDSATPPLWAQRLYFDFLWRLKETPCRHAVVIAGNHDAPALLDGPRELLAYLDIHVRGLPDLPPQQVLALRDRQGELELLVYADPFLRLRDLASARLDEDPQQQRQRALEAMGLRYRQAAEAMSALRGSSAVPTVVMGHLFAAGGLTGGEERDLSVGSLDAVPLDLFPSEADYLALGHIHRSQRIGQRDNWRYAGSPLALGFSESDQVKEVLLVDFDGATPQVQALAVPCFQRLARLSGTALELEQRLEEIGQSGEALWLELTCQDPIDGGLWERFSGILQGSPAEILRLRGGEALEGWIQEGDLAEEWSPLEVFQALLQERQVHPPEDQELTTLYQQVLEELRGEELP